MSILNLIYNLLLINPEKINENFLESFDISIFSEIFHLKIIDHLEISLKIIKILVKDFSNIILKKITNILKEFIYIFFFLEKINQIIILEIFIDILKKAESDYYSLILSIINNFFEFVQNFQEKNLFMIFLKRSYYFIKKLKKINFIFKDNSFENSLNIFLKNLLLNFSNFNFGFLSYLDLLNEKSIFINFSEKEKHKIILKTLDFFYKIDFKFENNKNKALFKIIKLINNFDFLSNNYIEFLKNNISAENYFYSFLKKRKNFKNINSIKNNNSSEILEFKNESDLNYKKKFKKKLKSYFINFFIDIFINLNHKIKNIKLFEILKFEFILFLIKDFDIRKKNKKIFSIFNLLSFYIKKESNDIEEIYNLSSFFIFRNEKFQNKIKNLPIKKSNKKKIFNELKKNIDENNIKKFKGNWTSILNLYNSLNLKNEKSILFINIKNLLTLKLLFELRKFESKKIKKYYFLEINYKKKKRINFNKNHTFEYLLTKLKKKNNNKKKYIIINKKYYFEKKDKLITLFYKSKIDTENFSIKSLKFTDKINKDFFLCLNKYEIFDFINEFYLPIIKNILKKFYERDIIKNLSLSSKKIIFEILKRNFNFEERLEIFKKIKKSKLKKQRDEKNLIINREDNLEKIFSKIIFFKNFNNVKVQFENEEGFGIGVLKEFFFILSEKLKDYKFFEELNNKFRIKYLYLEYLEKLKEIFFYLGIIFGRVFNQNLIFNFFLTKLFWNFVLNRVI